MIIYLYLFVFILSFFILAYASNWLVDSLDKLARFLKWKEFVTAFFTMALGATVSNFSVGISSALRGIPELSFWEITGGNVIDLTLAVALAILIGKGGLVLPSRVVQGSAYFVLLVTALPLFLILDMNLSRLDGLVLIAAFIAYLFWLFSKNDRFNKEYKQNTVMGIKEVFKTVVKLFFSVIFLIVAAEGIVRSSSYIVQGFGVPLALLGVLIIGLGNALPEIFFSVQAARKNKGWMVIGNLMGSVILPGTLVLGAVVLIHPISISNFSPFFIGRLFLLIATLFFLVFIKTEKTISRKEGIFLLALYLLFIFVELLWY